MSIRGRMIAPLLARRSLSSTVVSRLYIQNNLSNDQTHPKLEVDGARKVADFRSDTVTAPTDEMFEVMKKASRGDDVFQEDNSVRDLEAYMAETTGHQDALFCSSGTLTNQLGLCTHLTTPPHSVVCDSRSHVYLWEAGGISFHSRASVSPVIARNGIHVTAEEIEGNLIEADLHTAPTRVVSLENTLSGLIFPIEEIRAISEMSRGRGLAMHLDGARLWNASQETGIPLSEYGKCFDSMSLCLSKGVGAPIGSILVGNREFINRARHLRKLFGGGWRQAGFMAATAQYCIDNIVPTMPATHKLAKYMSESLVSLGISLQVPVHTNMVLIDTAPVGITIQDLMPSLLAKNIKIGGMGTKSRLVLHHQINKEDVDEFVQVVKDVVASRQEVAAPQQVAAQAC
ncbi:pyridoxal phosphate-dependent transferase [Phycomyces blakesleeanus]